jgi:hypothetical protein
MKNHLYLLAALVMILSMVIVGCAPPAPTAAAEEPAASVSHKEGDIMATNAEQVQPFPLKGVAIAAPEGLRAEEKDIVRFWEAGVPEHIEFMRPVFAFDLLEGDEKVPKGTPMEPPLEIWVVWTPADVKKEKRPTLMIDWEDGAGWQEAEGATYHPHGHFSVGGVAHLVIEEWLGEDPRFGWSD